MKWLIEHYLEDDELLKEAAQKLNLDTTFKIIYNIEPKDWKDYGLLHSSIQLAKATEKFTFHLCPFDRLRFQVYAAYWHNWLFNDDYYMMPAGALLERWNYKNGLLFGDKELFIRPDTNDKIFNGGVYTKEDFENLLKGFVGIGSGCTDMTPETLVVVGPAYKIDKEWRCFMHNGKLIDASLYKEDGGLNLKNDHSIKEYAESIPMYPGLPPVYVLDICESAGNLYLLETGSANVAGLYACDPYKVFSAIAQETELIAQETLV